MPDYYHLPALALSALLLPAFGYLYRRFRDTRTLLWLLAFILALASMLLRFIEWPWSYGGLLRSWMYAGGHTAILASSALFLASLSPARFRLGRIQFLYVIPYTIPLVTASLLFYGIYGGISPAGWRLWLFPALGTVSLVVAVLWGAAQNRMPAWLGVTFCAVLGGLTLWACLNSGAQWALTFAESANFSMTALLLIFVFPRLSPGVVLSALGFLAWACAALEIIPAVADNAVLDLHLIHAVVLGRVVAAMGMILLTLEDQLTLNKAAEERERRARRELEAYTNLILPRRRVEEFDHQGGEICKVVVAHSRFAQAALLLESGGRFKLAGAAGLDEATVAALAQLAARIPPASFLASASVPPAVGQCQTVWADLAPWLVPGDDLKRLWATSMLAVPMPGQGITEGALLLAGMRPLDGNPLRADDLLPIELLTARLHATRSQTMLFEKLIDSEKFAGLGQLAANVTHHLNNPLTVILGYASLLEEIAPSEGLERKGVDSILTEARRMRSTLESLTRISKTQSDQHAAVSVAEMLADMEQLHRAEFMHRAIDFRLSIAPALPRVMCSAQQLRQAVLHCLQYSVTAVESHGPSSAPRHPKTIRLEATSEGSFVQILVAHSGPGFPNPERAFDPFANVQIGETAGMGLSLCATILRDHKGRASAMNLDPQGAAIILELSAA